MRRAIPVAALLVALLALSGCSGTDRRLTEQHVERICAARGGVVFYDVQGENVLVYACNDDHVLKTIAY